MKEKVIYKSFEKCCVINRYNKVIKNLISENYILNDIDFNSLPYNIFNNIPLYLGNNYQTLDINLFQFKNVLFRNIQIELDKSYWNYNLHSDTIKEKFVYYAIDKVLLIRELNYLKELLKYTDINTNSVIISTLISGLIEQKYNLPVITVVTKL